jgi:hypothetical protein
MCTRCCSLGVGIFTKEKKLKGREVLLGSSDLGQGVLNHWWSGLTENPRSRAIVGCQTLVRGGVGPLAMGSTTNPRQTMF